MFQFNHQHDRREMMIAAADMTAFLAARAFDAPLTDADVIKLAGLAARASVAAETLLDRVADHHEQADAHVEQAAAELQAHSAQIAAGITLTAAGKGFIGKRMARRAA